jgi:phosphocarrier protein HPr
MPDVQDAVVQGTLWESLATRTHLGLTYVPVLSEHSERFPEGDGGMCPVEEQYPSVGQSPDPRQPQFVQTVWVSTPEGLHLRKCAAIAELVGQYQARVTLQKGDHAEDAASVLGLMMLAATQGTPLTLSATGPEAEDAFRAVVQLFDETGEVFQVMRRSWHPRAPR